MAPPNDSYDVIVVGGGNAALCAALSAREHGARVALLERAPEAERGGNSSFTEMMRFAFEGVDDIRALCPDLTDEEVANSDFGTYTADQYFDDMARVTQNLTDPDLCETIVRNSKNVMHWLRKNGVRFMPWYGKQAHKVNGKFKFFGGCILQMWGGGEGLVTALYKRAEEQGVDVYYNAWVKDLISTDDGVRGVVVELNRKTQRLNAAAVVLACGGFESNAEWRVKYLGKGWDLAKVRGTKYNHGEGLAMAMRIGAAPYGHWSGCHAVSWERYATEFGDRVITPNFRRQTSYQFGLMVNSHGKRFVDEGADFRNFTYAKYGQLVLEQPGQYAYQIFDAKVNHLLWEGYKSRYATRVTANTIEELAEKLEDVNRKQLVTTIKEYNASVRGNTGFDPTIKDGCCTTGLDIPKSNWALLLDTPPFDAYAVTCAITFTYGGIRVTPREAAVVNTGLQPIPGLYAAGEMVGGIFYYNYPGGTGLMSGAVFGRIAGRSAAEFSRERHIIS